MAIAAISLAGMLLRTLSKAKAKATVFRGIAVEDPDAVQRSRMDRSGLSKSRIKGR
jgi:hypothetical protein